MLLILLIGGSAFFSGAETALFSLSRARLLSWREVRSGPRRAVTELMSSYHHTLIVLILGNMFVNVCISMTEDELIKSLTTNRILAEILSVFLAVFLLLIFGEVTPKTVALVHAEKLALKLAWPVWGLRWLLMPFIVFVNACFSVILNLLGRRKSEPLSHEEYSAFLETSFSGGAFSEAEQELLESALRINEKHINDVMTGRVDILCVHKEATAEEIAALIRRVRQGYFPVVAKDIDDADFILSSKRFFMLTPEERRDWATSDAVFPTLFVPEQAGVLQAVGNMNQVNAPAALVPDEYGRIAGMVTREDVFAEIIGDIDDEYDLPDYSYVRTGEDSWRFSGMIPCFLFEELTGWLLPEELESTTVNGLFSELLGRLPVRGDEITVDNLLFCAENISKHRANSFTVRRQSVKATDEEDEE